MKKKRNSTKKDEITYRKTIIIHDVGTEIADVDTGRPVRLVRVHEVNLPLVPIKVQDK